MRRSKENLRRDGDAESETGTKTRETETNQLNFRKVSRIQKRPE